MKAKNISYIICAFLVSVSLGMALIMTGCIIPSVISKATVEISQDLKTLTLTLIFTDQIKSTLSETKTVGNYGTVFLKPYSATDPFEAGFNLNTSVLNDQNYVNLTPSTNLPNGMPTGVGVPLAEVQADGSINPDFNLFAYLDVAGKSWIGMAAIFNFLSDSNFPADLSASEILKRDTNGNPEILASVFGPVLNSDGTLKQAGGISLFANVRELIAGGLTPENPLVIEPKTMELVKIR